MRHGILCKHTTHQRTSRAGSLLRHILLPDSSAVQPVRSYGRRCACQGTRDGQCRGSALWRHPCQRHPSVHAPVGIPLRHQGKADPLADHKHPWRNRHCLHGVRLSAACEEYMHTHIGRTFPDGNGADLHLRPCRPHHLFIPQAQRR